MPNRSRNGSSNIGDLGAPAGHHRGRIEAKVVLPRTVGGDVNARRVASPEVQGNAIRDPVIQGGQESLARVQRRHDFPAVRNCARRPTPSSMAAAGEANEMRT